MSEQDVEAVLCMLAQNAAMLKMIATSASVLAHTIAAFDCNQASEKVCGVATAIDQALETGSANADQLEKFAKDLRRIASTLDTALYMSGFNAPCERSVGEWRMLLNAIMAS